MAMKILFQEKVDSVASPFTVYVGLNSGFRIGTELCQPVYVLVITFETGQKTFPVERPATYIVGCF